MTSRIFAQAAHYCALAGVSSAADEEGSLRLRVVTASDSADSEKQTRHLSGSSLFL